MFSKKRATKGIKMSPRGSRLAPASFSMQKQMRYYYYLKTGSSNPPTIQYRGVYTFYFQIELYFNGINCACGEEDNIEFKAKDYSRTYIALMIMDLVAWGQDRHMPMIAKVDYICYVRWTTWWKFLLSIRCVIYKYTF